jgi:hypothetical protein
MTTNDKVSLKMYIIIYHFDPLICYLNIKNKVIGVDNIIIYGGACFSCTTFSNVYQLCFRQLWVFGSRLVPFLCFMSLLVLVLVSPIMISRYISLFFSFLK